LKGSHIPAHPQDEFEADTRSLVALSIPVEEVKKLFRRVRKLSCRDWSKAVSSVQLKHLVGHVKLVGEPF